MAPSNSGWTPSVKVKGPANPTQPWKATISAAFAPFNMGEWSIKISPHAAARKVDQITLNCCLTWNSTRPAPGYHVEGHLHWKDGSARHSSAAGALFSVPEGILMWRTTVPHWAATELEVLVHAQSISPSPRVNAQHSLAVYSSLCKLGVDLRCSYPLTPASSLSQQSSHNDVRFFFPRIDRELWANAEFLKLASPYFKTLLESDFAEGQKRERSEHVAKGEVVSESTAWEDSDDESDQALAPKDLIRDDCHVPIHQVVVTETAYTTYTAVLIYLSSGVINFTKLHAAEKSSEQLSTTERSASPKSVYRLAHLLSLPDLCALAFAAIEEQLSPDNAFAELLSPVSVAYDEVSNMISTYMIEHWDEIKQVLSVEGMLSKMQEEGVELPLEVMMKLLLKLKG